MPLTSLDDLEGIYDDNQLWEIAANRRNHPMVRHKAIRRWLALDEDAENPIPIERLSLLEAQAVRLDPDEIEEDDIEDQNHHGPFFDGAGRLLIEHNNKLYLIEPLDDDDYADADAEDDLR